MIKVVKYISVKMILFVAVNAYAQDSRQLIAEGIQLSNAGNYSAAVEKYKAALAADSANVTAKYQMAFSLNAMGKGTSALPYLQQVIKANLSQAVLSSSYGLVADIYDRSGQPKNAIENYKLAIKIDTANYALLYGLGLAYFRDHQYAEAEKAAVKAINTDPKQAGAMRLYGLVTFHQNKRAPALLSLCYFLWLEPNGSHSQEAYGNIQSILQGGVLKTEPGVKAPHADAANLSLNQAITGAVTAVDKRRYFAPADKFTEQLQAVFSAVGTVAQKQNGHTFFQTRLANLFLKLSQSGNMPAFARTISQASDKASAAWLTSHQPEKAAFAQWMSTNDK